MRRSNNTPVSRQAASSSATLALRDSVSALPESVQEFIKVLGNVDSALALMHAFGGQTVRMPMSGKGRGERAHPFMAHINARQMARLTQYYGGTEIYLPRCHVALCRARNALIVQKFSVRAAQGEASGPLVRQLAVEYRISDRMVWRILKET